MVYIRFLIIEPLQSPNRGVLCIVWGWEVYGSVETEHSCLPTLPCTAHPLPPSALAGSSNSFAQPNDPQPFIFALLLPGAP